MRNWWLSQALHHCYGAKQLLVKISVSLLTARRLFPWGERRWLQKELFKAAELYNEGFLAFATLKEISKANECARRGYAP